MVSSCMWCRWREFSFSSLRVSGLRERRQEDSGTLGSREGMKLMRKNRELCVYEREIVFWSYERIARVFSVCTCVCVYVYACVASARLQMWMDGKIFGWAFP